MQKFKYLIISLCVVPLGDASGNERVHTGGPSRTLEVLLPITEDYIIRIWSRPISRTIWLDGAVVWKDSGKARTRWIDAEPIAGGSARSVWHDITDLGGPAPFGERFVSPGRRNTVAVAVPLLWEHVYFREFAIDELERSFSIPEEVNVHTSINPEERTRVPAHSFSPLQLIRERYPSLHFSWPVINWPGRRLKRLSWEDDGWTMEIAIQQGVFAFRRLADADAWTLKGPIGEINAFKKDGLKQVGPPETPARESGSSTREEH